MANEILRALADGDIPARPPNLSLQVHERLNALLVVLHLAEFAIQTLPYAFLHFSKALLGACQFSLCGKFPSQGEDHAK